MKTIVNAPRFGDNCQGFITLKRSDGSEIHTSYNHIEQLHCGSLERVLKAVILRPDNTAIYIDSYNFIYELKYYTNRAGKKAKGFELADSTDDLLRLLENAKRLSNCKIFGGAMYEPIKKQSFIDIWESTCKPEILTR